MTGRMAALRRLLGRPSASGSVAGEGSEQRELLARAEPADRAIAERALAYSMTGPARMLATVDAARYCVRRGIPGAFTECGVWRGGSVLAMILTLQDLGVDDREIYLYDTFEGMTEPTEDDVSEGEGSALEAWREATARGERPWSEAFGEQSFNEDDVRGVILGTGYPAERIHFVRGRVEDTIPAVLPAGIALLRLDTDWYESTRHELDHLFPLLAEGGALIIDDYGHWQGARRAVDEYFAERPLLLARIDYTGRIAVKA